MINKKKMVSAVLGLVMAGSCTIISLAEEPAPHILYGTERVYGEESTQHKELLQQEGTMSGVYAILPKNDTFTFDIGSSNIKSTDNVEISWECPLVDDTKGQISLPSDVIKVVKKEKLEFCKEYKVYVDEVKTYLDSARDYYARFCGTENIDNPFIIIRVTDYDINHMWWCFVHVTDEWIAPGNTANSKSESAHWERNEKGWWVVNPDGSYIVNAWYQSPASGLWYYLGSDGYMLTNTTTPDGYFVGEDGAWMQ